MSSQLTNRSFRGNYVLADTKWIGHHATYFFAMCEDLLDSNFRVIALCPAPDEVAERFQEEAADGRIHFGFLDHGRSYLPGRDHEPISTYLRWRRMRDAIRKAESETGWKSDFVFLPRLDSFIRFGLSSALPDMLGTSWSGLYFQNYHLISDLRPLSGLRHYFRGDLLFNHRKCKIIGQLDDRPAQVLLNSYDIEPILFPDITDETAPSGPTPEAAEVTRLAKGRTVFGLIGLEPRKGVMHLLRIARQVPTRPWFFVFTGTFDFDLYTKAEQEVIRNIKADIESGEIEHIYLDLSGNRISDGNDYNALVEAFDILMAVYPGFQCSSNALTKAAAFKKRVLAARGGCIADRVESFEMGVTINPDNIADAIVAMERLVAGEKRSGETLEPQFEAYRDLHSRERLKAQLRLVYEASVQEIQAEVIHEEPVIAHQPVSA